MCDNILLFIVTKVSPWPSVTEYLFNATIGHGLGPANSLPLHLKGRPLVCGHTLSIGVQVRLDLLPDLLLRVQLLVRLSCLEKNQQVTLVTRGYADTLRCSRVFLQHLIFSFYHSPFI